MRRLRCGDALRAGGGGPGEERSPLRQLLSRDRDRQLAHELLILFWERRQLADLARQESSAALARRLKRYTNPRLLCIDEVGYLSYDSRYADLLFEVVTRRYDAKRFILLTINKPFSQWHEVFPHAACTVTLVDRLVHRAEVIEIAADSYRLKEAKELRRRKAKKPKPSA